MIFPRFYLFIIILFGLILLYSYYELLSKTKSIDVFWGAIKGNLKTFYMISLGVIICAFILLLFYLMNTNSLTENEGFKIFIALFGITIFSLFWLPLSLLYVNYDKNKFFIKYLIILTLFLVSFSALYFLFIFKDIKDTSLFKKIVFYGMFYLFCHVFFLDFIFWDYFFFKDT
jgi:hypothetical protein